MGGKRSKLPPPKDPAPARTQGFSAASDPLDRVEAHLARTLDLVEAAINKGEATPAVVRESSNVARAIVTVSAERRARVKAETAIVEALTAHDVIGYLRNVADDRARQFIASELNDMLTGRAKKSGLA